MLKKFVCPNLDCKYTKEIQYGDKCPECGTNGIKMGLIELTWLEKAKKKKAKGEVIDMYHAQIIVKFPEYLDSHPFRYLMIMDTSALIKGPIFENLTKAIYILGEKGWNCINYEMIWTGSVAIGHALMERQSSV